MPRHTQSSDRERHPDRTGSTQETNKENIREGEALRVGKTDERNAAGSRAESIQGAWRPRGERQPSVKANGKPVWLHPCVCSSDAIVNKVFVSLALDRESC